MLQHRRRANGIKKIAERGISAPGSEGCKAGSGVARSDKDIRSRSEGSRAGWRFKEGRGRESGAQRLVGGMMGMADDELTQ
jgi:hypothetical protein